MSRLSKLAAAGQVKRSITLGGTGVALNLGDGFARGQGVFSTSISYDGTKETIDNSFESYVEDAYQANGIVYACVAARAMPFSEVRFQYQRLEKGRATEMYGNPGLVLLENPWPNGTTGELLTRAEQDESLAGNFYLTSVGTGADEHLVRLRPDWVTILTADPWTINRRILGYIYKPPSQDATLLSPERVVHWSPTPDPLALWRGMSWLTPVIREIKADSQATDHKEYFYKNGPLGNLVITYDKGTSKALFDESVALFTATHTGKENAYKAIHLGGGMDAKVLSQDLKTLDFKAIQGAGETRIAAAAGVGAIIGRFSEGMQGSSLNAGNYASARRQFTDMTIRPLWRSFTAAVTKIASVPGGSRLWYDDRDVAFVKEDRKDAADIQSKRAATINVLITAGFRPDAAVKAVMDEDLKALVGEHTGLYSVQLVDPATGTPDANSDPTTDPNAGGGA